MTRTHISNRQNSVYSKAVDGFAQIWRNFNEYMLECDGALLTIDRKQVLKLSPIYFQYGYRVKLSVFSIHSDKKMLSQAYACITRELRSTEEAMQQTCTVKCVDASSCQE